MTIKDFTIPPECRNISINTDNGRLIIEFIPEHPNDIFCKETKKIEKTPRIGDIAIFWRNEEPNKAIISPLIDEDFKDAVNKYKTVNDKWYENAIIFHDEEQYKTILNAKKILSPKEKD